jgi:hypothetical protein
MVAALAVRKNSRLVRHHLSDEVAQGLQEAVASSPGAAS